MKIISFANLFLKAAIEAIGLNEIKIDMNGLRNESFDFLEPYFIGKNTYPEFPEYIDKQKIMISDYPEVGKVVTNGRHRILLSKKHGIKEIPAIYTKYNDDLYILEQYPVRIIA